MKCIFIEEVKNCFGTKCSNHACEVFNLNVELEKTLKKVSYRNILISNLRKEIRELKNV